MKHRHRALDAVMVLLMGCAAGLLWAQVHDTTNTVYGRIFAGLVSLGLISTLTIDLIQKIRWLWRN